MQQQKEKAGVLPFAPQIVTKSNALCRGQYDYDSIFAGRIISELASRIRPDDQPDIFYDIPVANILNKKYAGEHLQQLIKVAENLVGRNVTIQTDSGRSFVVMTLITRFIYNDNSGIITLKIDSQALEHFIWEKNSKLQYTQYDYLEFKRLGTTYSQQLYELLKSWKDRAEFSVALDDLHWKLSTPPSYRKNFKNFRRFVLEPATVLITQETALNFTWEARKNGGKRVTEIRFDFRKKKISESEQEKIQKGQAKVKAYTKKRGEWFKSAHACALAKKGVCLYRDRSRSVCSICREAGFQDEIAKLYPAYNPDLPSDIRWSMPYNATYISDLPPDIIRSIEKAALKPITTGKNAEEQG